MRNLRKYGTAPYRVAVIHGGPGAPGQMAPVARELCAERGVLEPLQTASSLEGQVQELKEVLSEHGDLPVTLIGSSWGAMLSFIFAARYPVYVNKIILVGSGPYEDKYATDIMKTRLSRLSAADKLEVHAIMEALGDPETPEKNALMARFGALLTKKSDAYNPLSFESEVLECDYHIHSNVWQAAHNLRKSGKLLELGHDIQCPVVAVHGDYDPHPAEGVQKPLASILRDFKFILLKNCGHIPWIEKEARDRFYDILKAELR